MLPQEAKLRCLDAHQNIVAVVNAPSIDGILQEAMQVLPLGSPPILGAQRDDIHTCPLVAEAELVELGPALQAGSTEQQAGGTAQQATCVPLQRGCTDCTHRAWTSPMGRQPEQWHG